MERIYNGSLTCIMCSLTESSESLEQATYSGMLYLFKLIAGMHIRFLYNIVTGWVSIAIHKLITKAAG